MNNAIRLTSPQLNSDREACKRVCRAERFILKHVPASFLGEFSPGSARRTARDTSDSREPSRGTALTFESRSIFIMSYKKYTIYVVSTRTQRESYFVRDQRQERRRAMVFGIIFERGQLHLSLEEKNCPESFLGKKTRNPARKDSSNV